MNRGIPYAIIQTINGNFYEPEPNGVFFLNPEKTDIVETADFDVDARYDFALQSGPMLVQHGSINPSFPSNNTNKHFRCAVGIVREGSNIFLVFVSSESKVTFYDLALFMKKEQGCQEALHLESMNAFMHFPGSNYAADDQLIRNYIVID